MYKYAHLPLNKMFNVLIKEKIYSICNINIAYLYLIQGPAGPIGAPGIRGEDGNPGPRVRDVQACSFYFFLCF